MRGGGRFATFFCSSRTTSWRACLRSCPEASSRRCSMRVRIQSIACRTPAPSRSMTSNQETPRNSATPASHSPSSSKVAPEKTQAMRSCPAPPVRRATPPAVYRQPGAAPVQRRQTATRDQGQDESRGAQQGIDARARIGERLFLVHQPARVNQHQGKEVRRTAEQEQKKSRQPRAHRARSNC